MKLSDIKKLKVAELRSRLKEVGLDSRGLKAELVDRLWSASERGQSETDGETHVTLSNDSPTVEPRAPSPSPPPSEMCVTSPCCPDNNARREYTHAGTQTEPDVGGNANQHGHGFVSESLREHRAEGEEADDPGEDRGLLSEDTGRGRAFYEFKEEIRYKRAKSPQPPVDRGEVEEKDDDKVRLDTYDSHLHFEGRVSFEVRLERKLLMTQPEEPEVMEPCGVRVGWSVANTSLLLGQDELSFAYDGCGKKVSAGKEVEFGVPFSEGDIIGCYASLSSDSAVQLSFSKNGRFMGVAFCLSASVLQGRPLFPHVLCKTCSVRFLLAPSLLPGTPVLQVLHHWQLYLLARGFAQQWQLHHKRIVRNVVLLMVGLPGSGKSHWAKTHMKQHPGKQYRLLGTEELLACMIVSQTSFTHSGGQRDSRLQQACRCLTELIKTAAQMPGNYILDQCNVLVSARRHKLQLFTGFRRKAVVVFPPADEWKRRLLQHQMRDEEQIPETALLKLQVSCSLPEQQSELLEELQYVELPQEQAQMLLQEYKDGARRRLPPSPNRRRRNPDFTRKDPSPTALHHIGCSGLKGGEPQDVTCSHGTSTQDILLTALLRKTMSVDSWASTPPFQYNSLTSSDLSTTVRYRSYLSRLLLVQEFAVRTKVGGVST
ncbi:hypothetical protein INR49_017719 [Caranx melampygus]|nr:hypothetical protein INR49_017719 [Caranx melampygus]